MFSKHNSYHSHITIPDKDIFSEKLGFGKCIGKCIILCVYHYPYILINIETTQETPCNDQEKSQVTVTSSVAELNCGWRSNLFVHKSCLVDFFLLRFFKSYREIKTLLL